MSVAPNTENSGQWRPAHQRTCNDCGGIIRRLSVLDTREGKNYRLLRCTSCEKMSWAEEV